MLLNKDRAVALMHEQHLDALVAVASPNVYYLSDYDAAEPKDVPWTAAAVLPRDAGTERLRATDPVHRLHPADAVRLRVPPRL